MLNKNFIYKYPFLRYFLNKYVLILLFFIIWMLFLDNYSYLEHRILNKEIKELENNIEYYQTEINKDSIQIKKLNNIHTVEHYGREKYYMKRNNEDLYIKIGRASCRERV